MTPAGWRLDGGGIRQAGGSSRRVHKWSGEIRLGPPDAGLHLLSLSATDSVTPSEAHG